MLNSRWKYETSNILCVVCDLFMAYHKRTRRFYCPCCPAVTEICELQSAQKVAWIKSLVT